LEPEGGVLGRYGGDEFVIILPEADHTAAQEYRAVVARRLHNASVTDPQTGARVPVSTSLGVSFYPEDSENVLELIKVSDTAMYAARRQRPVISDHVRMPLREDEAAARVVAELIPLLVAEGTLDTKLRQLGHRLCTGAGYDAATITLYSDDPNEPPISHTVGSVAEQLAAAWDTLVRRDEVAVPIRELIQRGRRPLVLNDLQTTRLLAPDLRRLLERAELKSGVVAPMLWQGQLLGALGVASSRASAFGPKDAEFLVAVAAQVTAIVRMAKLLEDLTSATARLAEAQDETVMLLAAAAEAHEAGMSDHFKGVRVVAEMIAAELGYSAAQIREVGLAAALHDVGKIRVPHEALANSGPLAGEQWELMKQHTVWGEEFFSGRSGFSVAARVARSHHEHWGGDGYPDGLAADNIPEAAAITGVADAFDAMVHQRPYSSARSVEEAVAEIISQSGTQFSPHVVEALLRLHRAGQLPLPHSEREQAAA
jgi:HD-GYP domain-containing protein (c-di-GMP phosphodiesterase class II)